MIYVLIHEYQFDTGENGITAYSFDTFEKAQAKMKELAKELEIIWEEFFDTNYEKEESENGITFFECGEYAYNHENILIQKTTLN